MKTITKSIITISALSLLLAGCGDAKKDAKSEKKVSTIEEIQKVNGKPARVVKAATVKLTDVRAFSGTIEGSQQTTATAKLGDPIAKVNVRVGSKVRKDQVLAEFVFTGDNTAYQQAQANIAMQEKSLNRLKEVQAKGGVSLQDVEQLLGSEFYHVLPNDFGAAQRSIQTGCPLVLDGKTTPLKTEMRNLVARYTNRPLEKAKEESSVSWFKKIFQ